MRVDGWRTGPRSGSTTVTARREPALLVHDAGLGHDQRFPALVVAERARRAPARDVRDHQPRIPRRERLGTEPEALGGVRPQRIHHDVGAPQQCPQPVEVSVIVQVERHAALATQQRRPARELPQRTAVGRLNHDHLGTAVGEELRRLRAGQRRRQVNHHEAGQRTVRRRTDDRHVALLASAGESHEAVK